MRRLRDWVLTVPFLVAFGATLVVYDLIGRVVLPFSLRAFEYTMASLQRSLLLTFRICGTRIEVERSPLVHPKTGYAVISNHQSLFDIVMIGGFLFDNYPKYVAKKELGRRLPSISLNLKRGGNALIDRDDRMQSVRAIEEMARTAQERGVSVVIFPEGSRSRDGSLQDFRPAGGLAMLQAADRLPVIPTTIDGSWRLLEHNLKPVPFGTRVRIRFGDPIERQPNDAAALMERSREEIATTLREWRPAPTG